MESIECRRANLLGEAALRRGEVASLVVAGGAGTRFGGVAKALVEVAAGQTFLDLKLAEAARALRLWGRPLPIAVMTSHLTHDAIEAAVRESGLHDVFLFRQRSLPRLSPDGRVWLDSAGAPSFAPAGHGDVFRALKESGVAAELRRRGVRRLLFSNVDNLAATIEPVVAGLHVGCGRPLLVEVTERRTSAGLLDVGAAPVRRHGFAQLVEQVDPERFQLISTNNLWFELDALTRLDLPLPFRLVRKRVEGSDVLQFEQVTGEVTQLEDASGDALLSTAFLRVPREPAELSRFEPVKTPADLPRVASRLRGRLFST